MNAGQIDQIKGVGPAIKIKNYVSIPFTERNQATEFAWKDATTLTLNGAF